MIFKFKHKKLGGHVHVDLFSGTNLNALGKNGTIIFREEEWEVFDTMLAHRSFAGAEEVIVEEVTPILSE